MKRMRPWVVTTLSGTTVAWLLATEVLPALVGSVVDATLVACVTAVVQAAVVRGQVHALGWVGASTVGSAAMYSLTPIIGFMGGPWVMIPLMTALAALQVWLWRFAWRGAREPFRRCARNTIAAHASSGVVMWMYVLSSPLRDQLDLRVPYSSSYYVLACSDALLVALGSSVLAASHQRNDA